MNYRTLPIKNIRYSDSFSGLMISIRISSMPSKKSEAQEKIDQMTGEETPKVRRISYSRRIVQPPSRIMPPP